MEYQLNYFNISWESVQDGPGIRVGGWNAPFVTFSGAQQRNYLKRGFND